MKSRDEIAIKLAQITGRPIEEFLDVEEENDTDTEQSSSEYSKEHDGQDRQATIYTGHDEPDAYGNDEDASSRRPDDNIGEIEHSRREYPVDEFFRGQLLDSDNIKEESYVKENKQSDIYKHTSFTDRTGITECTNSTRADEDTEKTTDNSKSSHKLDDDFGGQLVNGKILGGREMTRKEYLKYTKGLTRNDIVKHKYIYKMFRSEKQTEVFFDRWINSFPKE